MQKWVLSTWWQALVLWCGVNASNATDFSIVYETVSVPAGEFAMGTTDQQQALLKRRRWWLSRFAHEKPAHRVHLDAFNIGTYEVTNSQWNVFARATGRSEKTGPETHPVVEINWFDARAFCTAFGMRLPTEAEWEQAARGTDGRLFPWAAEIDSSLAHYWDDGHRTYAAMPAGRFPKGVSPYGAFAMAGNVLEWVADWYDPDYYARSPAQNPTGPEDGKYRIVRGGAWTDAPRSLRTAMRWRYAPEEARVSIGFRCAR